MKLRVPMPRWFTAYGTRFMPFADAASPELPMARLLRLSLFQVVIGMVTALLVGTGRAAQLGIVIKGPQILESTRRIDTFVLDKTGTITENQMHVRQVDSPDSARASKAIAISVVAGCVFVHGDRGRRWKQADRGQNV